MKENKGIKNYFGLFTTVLVLIIIYKALDNYANIMGAIGAFLKIITPFLVGIIISYLLYSPSKKIEKALKKSKCKLYVKRARGLSVLITYILFILIIILGIKVLVPILTQSVTDLINNIPMYYEVTMNQINSLPEDSIFRTQIVQNIINSIKNININDFINFSKIAEYVKGVLSLAYGVFDIFVALIVSIYVLLEREQISGFINKFIYAIFNEKTYNNVQRYIKSMNEIFLKFLTSQFLDAIIIGVLTSFVMNLIGVKYAVLLGFMIGLFNMIPYFGAIIAVAIAIFITFITGGISQAIVMAICVIILQQIDANIINPKILGNSLKISPLLVIFAVTVGGAYFGVLGMFLAVPVVTIFKVIICDYIKLKTESKVRKYEIKIQ